MSGTSVRGWTPQFQYRGRVCTTAFRPTLRRRKNTNRIDHPNKQRNGTKESPPCRHTTRVYFKCALKMHNFAWLFVLAMSLLANALQDAVRTPPKDEFEQSNTYAQERLIQDRLEDVRAELWEQKRKRSRLTTKTKLWTDPYFEIRIPRAQLSFQEMDEYIRHLRRSVFSLRQVLHRMSTKSPPEASPSPVPASTTEPVLLFD